MPLIARVILSFSVIVILVCILVLFGLIQQGCITVGHNNTPDIETLAATVQIGMANVTYYTLSEITDPEVKIDIQQALLDLSARGIEIFSATDPSIDNVDRKAKLIDVIIGQVKLLNIVSIDEARIRESLNKLSLKELVLKLLDTVATLYPKLDKWRDMAKDTLTLLDAWFKPEVEYSENTRILLLAFFTGIRDGCGRVVV